ncbi:Gbp5 (predicted), partial [Pycnogonum litorale]
NSGVCCLFEMRFIGVQHLFHTIIILTILLLVVTLNYAGIEGKQPNAEEQTVQYKDEPIQLVRPDEEHRNLVIIEENLKLLQSISSTLAIVAVVGKFHSGKSFLMNQLMRKSNGFGVGPFVKPETMGIWMWGQPMVLTLKNNESISVIFLDTEGFAANNVSENYDAKIFSVTTLMSSYLIYNSVKIIDQADIDYLELLSRRTQLFALRSQMSRVKWTDDFNHDLLTFPPLLWVVQDFVQMTVDGETPKEWLHRLMGTHVRENEDYIISLLSIFKSIDCHTLFLPAVKRHLLMNLSRATEEDLTDEYKTERDQLNKKLRAGIVPKAKNNKPLTGPGLAALLHILVNAANEGSLSEVPSRWNVFIERLKSTATEDCLQFYEAEMMAVHKETSDKPFPMKSFTDLHKRVANNTLRLLDQLLFGLDDALTTAMGTLKTKLSQKFNRMVHMNEKNIKLYCNEQLHRAELNAENELQRYRLPMLTEELIKKLNELNRIKSTELNNRLTEYLSESAAKKFVEVLKNSLKDKSESLMLQNNKALESLLVEADKVARDKFIYLCSNEDGKARPNNVIDSVLESSFEQALELFGKESGFVRAEKLFTLHLGNLKSRLVDEMKIVRKRNEESLGTQLKVEVDRLTAVFKENTGANKVQLPLNDTDLESVLNAERRRCLVLF